MEMAPSMTFTGPLQVGGPNVTLTGTAESIYHKIVELNPSYDAWQFPEYRSKMAALGLTQDTLGAVPVKRHGQLEKRGGVSLSLHKRARKTAYEHMLTQSIHSLLAIQMGSRWTIGSPNVLRESATWAASTDTVVRREAGVAALASAARIAAAYFSATMYVSQIFLLFFCWGGGGSTLYFYCGVIFF